MSTIRYKRTEGKKGYIKLLRQFKLDDLLKYINSVSARIFNNKTEFRGTIKIPYTVQRTDTYEILNQTVITTGWDLVDLSYNAIMVSNDHIGVSIKDDSEFGLLIKATYDNHEENEKQILEEFKDNDNKLLLYLWGFFGEQTKIQNLKQSIDNAGRELYILFDISKRIEFSIDIEEIVYEETGLKWQAIITSLYYALFCSVYSPLLFEYVNLITWDSLFKKEDYLETVKFYSATYDDVRESNLKRQILYSKPFIKTQNGEYISTNCYLNLFAYEHSVFWIVRNHYSKIKSQDFTNGFGILYEEYIRELFDYCLKKEQFEKIEVHKTKRADWRLIIGNYRFLIEQKSSLLRLSAKKQESNINDISHYAKEVIFDALEQLDKTEKYYSDGTYIKIILIYEDYLYPEIMDMFFKIDDCPVNKDNKYWLMTTEEMEMFMYTYKNDSELFAKIIDEKNARENSDYKQGKSIKTIMNEIGIINNEYIEKPEINSYSCLAEKNIISHIR